MSATKHAGALWVGNASRPHQWRGVICTDDQRLRIVHWTAPTIRHGANAQEEATKEAEHEKATNPLPYL